MKFYRRNQKIEDRFQRPEKFFKMDKARELEGKFPVTMDLYIADDESPKEILEGIEKGITLPLLGNFGNYRTGYSTLFHTKAVYDEALKKGFTPKIVNLLKDSYQNEKIGKSYLEEGIPAEDLIHFHPGAYGTSVIRPSFEDWSGWKKFENEIRSYFKTPKAPLSYLLDVGLALESGDAK
jgi:hypothetical protein